MRTHWKSAVVIAAVILAMSTGSFAAKADSDDPGGAAAQSAVRDARDSIYSREQLDRAKTRQHEKTAVSHIRHKQKTVGSIDRTVIR